MSVALTSGARSLPRLCRSNTIARFSASTARQIVVIQIRQLRRAEQDVAAHHRSLSRRRLPHFPQIPGHSKGRCGAGSIRWIVQSP